jgi:outer membrane protein TolC
VLRAIREAADQVGRVRQLDLQLDEQARGLEAAERAFALATQRYEAGLANYLTVIAADTSLSEARRNRANLLADRSLAGIALVVALGGGWSDGTAPARAAYVPTESPK